MAKNEILPFAAGEGANVLSQEDYENLIARLMGFSTGIAKAAELNKVWRQTAFVAHCIAQFVCDQTGKDVLDNGKTDDFLGLLGSTLGNSIQFCPVIPTEKQKSNIIFVPSFGLMSWNDKWKIYRSLNCGQKIYGWSKNPLINQVDAIGSILPKSGNYYALYTAAKDYELIVAADKWQVGAFHFVEVDADNFKIPDLRGYFDRNASMGSDIDKGREPFSAQSDAIRNFVGSMTFNEQPYYATANGALR